MQFKNYSISTQTLILSLPFNYLFKNSDGWGVSVKKEPTISQ